MSDVDTVNSSPVNPLGSGPMSAKNIARQKAQTRKNRGATIIQLGSILVFLALWQLSSLFLNKILLSNPVAIIGDFITIIANGILVKNFFGSMFEMFFGFALASAFGIFFGMMMGRFKSVERILDPFVNFGNATPTIALLPIMEVWFGLGFWARISFIFIISVWTMLINTLAGIKSVSRGWGDVGVAFGLSEVDQTKKIAIPAAVPYILAGARVALAQAAVGMILSGQEIGESGLGGLTERFSSYYQTGDLVAAIISSSFLAIIAFGLLRKAQNVFYPWIAGLAAAQK